MRELRCDDENNYFENLERYYGIMLTLLFWLLVAYILWIYLGYPLFLLVYTFLVRRSHPQEVTGEGTYPTVSMIIPCYNEAAVIEDKIENTLSQQYPMEKLEIIIISDGSTDETVEIAKRYKADNIRVIAREEQSGKTIVQNIAVQEAQGDILVFSDADCLYSENAVAELVSSFSDAKVAGVCGEVQFQERGIKKSVSKEENLFRKYERFIKQMESKLGTTIGFTGAIYAIRSKYFEIMPDELIRDFFTPLFLLNNGLFVCYNPTAVATEVRPINYNGEFVRKKRTILQGLYGMSRVKSLLNPLKSGHIAVSIWSHKILRWFIPMALLGLLVTNVLLVSNSPFFFVTFLVQLMFYGFGFIGWILIATDRYRMSKIFKIPFYFCLVNIASLIALYKYFRKQRIVKWVSSENNQD